MSAPDPCTCGHSQADHAHGSGWPWPVNGHCLVEGCRCQLFTDAEREETAA